MSVVQSHSFIPTIDHHNQNTLSGIESHLKDDEGK